VGNVKKAVFFEQPYIRERPVGFPPIFDGFLFRVEIDVLAMDGNAPPGDLFRLQFEHTVTAYRPYMDRPIHHQKLF
jgi:hypothetical protein